MQLSLLPLKLLQYLLLEEAGREELGEVEEAPVVALVVEEEEEEQRQELRTQAGQLLQQQDLLHKFHSLSILSKYETYLIYLLLHTFPLGDLAPVSEVVFPSSSCF